MPPAAVEVAKREPSIPRKGVKAIHAKTDIKDLTTLKSISVSKLFVSNHM
jgi:hypothetical protein